MDFLVRRALPGGCMTAVQHILTLPLWWVLYSRGIVVVGDNNAQLLMSSARTGALIHALYITTGGRMPHWGRWITSTLVGSATWALAAAAAVTNTHKASCWQCSVAAS